jgi:transposase
MQHSTQIKQKFGLLQAIFNERQRRLWAAAEARALGRGGITRVAEATGLSPKTIRAGLRELTRLEAGGPALLDLAKVRQPGGGRRLRTEQDPTLLGDLEALLEPRNRGPFPAPLHWTCKSTAQLAAELQGQGHAISSRKVGQLLHELGYSLRARRKRRFGGTSPDPDTQFAYVQTQVEAFHRRNEPVIALETQKQELFGAPPPAGGGEEPGGGQAAVGPPHFPNLPLPGVESLRLATGWVNTSVDGNTVEFAVDQHGGLAGQHVQRGLSRRRRRQEPT